MISLNVHVHVLYQAFIHVHNFCGGGNLNSSGFYTPTEFDPRKTRITFYRNVG